MEISIALVGNPNSGKTTLFNQLTGNHQYVGNWPGVTVEKKAGKIKSDKAIELVDLPGIYSLSPYTQEEMIARDYLSSGEVDAIINIVDATNLERNLYLTEQLMEFGVPVVVALNMMDVIKKRGLIINTKKLADQLGVDVVEISALKGTGIDEIVKAARSAALSQTSPTPTIFGDVLEGYLKQIDEQLPESVPENIRRFTTVKVFERDKKVLESLPSLDVEGTIRQAEKEFDDNVEGIITNARYLHITGYIAKVHKHSKSGLSISEKIDKVVTNRILALPIFVVVIALVYWVAVGPIGATATDWMNDGVFGDGWFAGGNEEYWEDADEFAASQDIIAEYVAAADAEGVEGAASIQAFIDSEEAVSEETPGFTAFVASASAAGITASYTPVDEESGEVITSEGDGAVLNYGADEVMAAAQVAEPDPSEYGLWVPGIPVLIQGGLDSIGCAAWVEGLVIDGIVGGVGAVLGFVPQILILFFMLSLLEGCGYMSRIAFILDRIFRRFGLSGKTFIPMLIGTGCGVPAIMASRTIESESSRRLTVMTTTFMPCSAKLPIIALFAGAIFGGAGWIAPLCYFIGIAAIIISGIILKKTKPFLGDTTPFVMELPEYRLPRFIDVLRSMWERGWSFIKRAGTIILAAAVLVWFLSSFGVENGSFGMVEDMDNSILAVVGSVLAWIFVPLGWGQWEFAAASVTGLIAKENLVGTLGVLMGGGAGLWPNLAAALTTSAALSMLLFNLLCAPCFAAMGAIRREMNSGKWFWAAIGYQCGFAYLVALVVYQIGSAIAGDIHIVGFIVALVVVAFTLFMLFRPAKKLQEGASKVATAQE